MAREITSTPSEIKQPPNKRKQGADCYKLLANIQKSIRCMADTKNPFILT